MNEDVVEVPPCSRIRVSRLARDSSSEAARMTCTIPAPPALASSLDRRLRAARFIVRPRREEIGGARP
jgi:hypothetical protein